MYHHIKKLMYTVNVGTPDPRFGNMLLEQFGGANGELAAAMQYSIPSLIASAVSPFHQIGAGSDTSTVSCEATAGLAIGIEPLAPVTSQLPIMLAAEAGSAMARNARVVTSLSFEILINVLLPFKNRYRWRGIRMIRFDL